MQVESKGELRALGVPWQPRAGAFALTVVAKATFDLRPMLSPLAEQQEDPNEDDNHWDDDRARSVYAPSDAAPFKAGADVVLVGEAFAPHRERVRSLVARIVVGGIDKSIEVFGNRVYGPNGAPLEPQEFSKMSLRYERAFGGPDTENPVGLSAEHASAPNLVRRGADVGRGVLIAPVGFGPVAPAWPTRAKLLARVNGFSAERLATTPVPEQLASAFFNVAPPDQQVARLATDEHIVLENLSAEHPLLVTNLPGLGARAFAARGDDLEEVKLAPDLLWIDTTRALMTLTFRGQLALHARDEPGTVFVLAEQTSRPLTFAEVKRACNLSGTSSATTTIASLPSIDGTVDSADFATNFRNALPFATPRPQKAPSPVVQLRPSPAEPKLPSTVDEVDREGTATEMPVSRADASPPWLAGPASVRASGHAVPAPIAATPPPLATSPIGHAHHPPSPPVAPPPPLGPIAPPAPVSAPQRQRPPSTPPTVANAAPASISGATDPLRGPSTRAPGFPAEPASLLAVSNAAAQAPKSNEAASEPGDARAAPAARPSAAPRDLVELLWFDQAAVEPLRKTERWKALVASLQPKKPRVAYDDDPLPEEPEGTRDRRDVFGVLAVGAIETPEDLEGLVEHVSGERGTFTPPLAIVAGEATFPFDELETLRATMTFVAPFASSDKKLKELVDTVNELLKTPWLKGSDAVAEGLLQRVRDAFAAQNRALPPGHLDAHTERILLAERHFQRRIVFGAPHLRATFASLGSSTPTVAYLPEALAGKLPMYQRLRVRMLVEVNLPQDQFESAPLSLRCVAFARVTSPLRRK